MQNNYDKLKRNDNSEVISDSDDSMPTTERELADEAQWKIVQKNTFTRWVNVHLKKANQSIADLQADFSDGLKLMALIEVLSGHKFPHVNKKPNFRTQKLENVTVVLKYLEEKEGLKLINIDSSDIVDAKLKLILGLIWALILHYSISMSIWDGEENKPQETKQTPKQRMMTWINAKMGDRPIRNLTTDWNDGSAIGALVDSCAPGLCPDWEIWKPQNALENTREAMETAEQWLNVPQLIRPEEMIDPNVDEKAMMTYLSQFPNAKLNPAAPIKPKLNPSKVRVYGPGVESRDLAIEEETEFTVDAFSAGKAPLEVHVTGPNGQKLKVNIEDIPQKSNCFKCSYLPTTKGNYIIHVKYSDRDVPHSPFEVAINKTVADPSKVKVYGPGIELIGLVVNKPTEFTISTAEAGTGEVTCVVLDPQEDKNSVPTKITQLSPTSYKVEYVPREVGGHSINVFFGGHQVPKSPFGVQISPKSNAKLVTVTGRGVQAEGIRVGDKVEFRVNTEEAGEANLEVKLTAPNKLEESVKVVQINPNYFECAYIPSKAGLYELKINYGGASVLRSPFKINVLPSKKSNITAFGPGLHSGVVDKAATFVTDTNGELGTLGFSIEGPSEARIECCDNQDGSATICYWPTAPGEYAVHVLCDGEDIPNSPFMATMMPKAGKTDISKIKVSGNGIQNGKVTLARPNEFTIDCNDYKSDIIPEACCYTSNGSMVPVSIVPLGNKKYQGSYQPETVGNHKLFIWCDNQSVLKSPYKLNIEKPSDPSSIKVFGEGVKCATRYSPAQFSIDTTQAGRGKLAVELFDEIGNILPTDISSEKNTEVFEVKYQPNTPGPVYSCSIRFDGMDVPGSPFQINIKPDIEVSKVFVENLETKIFQESFIRFIINAKEIDRTGKGTVKAIFTDPSSYKTTSMVKNNNDGTYKCTYSPYNAGTYLLDITYEDLPIKNSPFKVEVVPGCDPSRITVYGDGLKGGMTNQLNYFTIDLDGAGQGNLGLAIEGPSDARIVCTDNLDGTCTVEYSSTCPGSYDIYIKFNDVDITDSPYKVNIRDPINPKNVKCYGPALNKDYIHRLGESITFVIDASKAGEAPVEITCSDEEGNQIPVEVVTREHAMAGIFDVSYKPIAAGLHTVDVKYADFEVPGAPFNINILPKSEPGKVKLYGEGIHPTSGQLSPSTPTQFHIDISEAGIGDIQLSLSNPDDLLLPVDIIEEGNGIFCCQYTPVDAGRHCITVSFDDVPLLNSPFSVDVSPAGDASKCFIEDSMREYALIDTEMMITVNTAEAGEGKISSRILPLTESGEIKSNVSLPVEVEDNGNGTQSIYYTPVELTNYLIEIKFGGLNIPNGQFQQMAVDPNNLPQEMIEMERNKALQNATPNGFSDYSHGMYPVEFRLPVSTGGAVIEAYIFTPGGHKEEGYVHDNTDGSVTIRYEPKERGMHEMIVTYDNLPIQGSPYRFFAENAGVGKVAAYGPGLSHGKTGTPCEFTIVTKDAGAGGLSLAIEGPSKAEILCKDNENGSCDVTYYPMVPGDYSVIIKFADKNIPGSPFVANVTGEPHKRSQICIGNTSDVPLKIQNLDISTLTASVKAPSGKEEPCILKKMLNDNLGISFTPKEVGEHLINVYQSGAHILGSPFKIIVGKNEIGDASKVRVYGDGLKTGNSNEANAFTVDTREAGYGGLSLSIEGPSKADIECRDNYDGTCQVSYTPLEPGTYMVNIRYANEHVLGSPFVVRISGEPSARLMEKIIRRQEAADVTQIGSECELTLKIPGTSASDMRATVTSQGGLSEVCEIVDLDDGHYSIRFVPREMGLHTVVVRHRNVDIPGSPFQFTVGPIVDGGAHKVSSSGAGLKAGRLNETNEFSIYTREAGAGGLTIAIEGPSKAEITFEDRKDGSCNVMYRVSEAGEYVCSIKFNDEHINNSPFRIAVQDQLIDYVSVASVDSGAFAKDLMIGKPAAFTVNYKQTSKTLNKLKAVIKGPSGNEEAAIIQNIEKNQYAIRFIPKESGEHLVTVVDEHTGLHIPGSPFRVVIGAHHADPSLVHARGDGLSNGYIGKKSSFIINTQHSGTGSLNVTIDGPSKVQLYSQEHEEGYEFFYIPAMAGDYNITIKYGGNFHIPGSPFTATIRGSTTDRHQDPSVTSKAVKVQCQGLGLKKAALNQANTFNVDASQAGNDILFVGIAGPKSQCEEVSVKRTGQNQFIINYWVQEKGRHHLMVKWGEKNIPGSPFLVDVL